MHQLMKVLHYLHSNRVVHRDIKPDNILVHSQTAMLKLADFGLARQFFIPHTPLTPQVQTLWYRAPELILGDTTYSMEVDIWAAACVFFEMLTGRILFMETSEVGLLFSIFQLFGTPTLREWPALAGMAHYKASFPKFQPGSIWSKMNGLEDEVAVELLQHMLKINPADRFTAQQCLQHRYFAGVDFDAL